MKISDFQKIPPFTQAANYAIDVEWRYLETQIEHAKEGVTAFELDPDFQRGHVWTNEQRSAYVEFILRGGQTGRNIYFNCPNFMHGTGECGPYVCVDGLQRLTAARLFMANVIPAFGTLYKDFTGKLRMQYANFKWHVNELKTRAEVLQWYLEFNSAGTPHTEEELDRVRNLLEKEQTK